MHRHKWTVREKTVLPSAFEQLESRAEGALQASGAAARTMFEKPCIVHYACECGAERVVRV
jgi:hypothetical protein